MDLPVQGGRAALAAAAAAHRGLLGDQDRRLQDLRTRPVGRVVETASPQLPSTWFAAWYTCSFIGRHIAAGTHMLCIGLLPQAPPK